MGLDLRIPIGMMFGLIGLVMVFLGLFSQEDSRQLQESVKSININLWWGLVLIAFATFMLVPALRDAKKNKAAADKK